MAFVAEGTSFPLVHVPSVVMFLATAYLVEAGRISLVTAIVVGTLGSATGGFITYRLGVAMSGRPEGSGPGLPLREIPPGVTRKRGRFWTSPDRLARVTGLIARYGTLLALAARWLGVLRPAALLGTGLARLNPWKVAGGLILSSLLYCGFYQMVAVGVADLSAPLLDQVKIETALLAVLGLGLAWAAVLYLLRKLRA